MAINIARRKFIAAVGGTAFAWPLAAHAQQHPKALQVGFLYPGVETAVPSRVAAVLSGLQAAGLRESDQIAVVVRATGGDPGKLKTMAADLVERKVDVIMPVTSAALRAVIAATATIPIVAGDFESDPVAAGFVASIARPGGNVTGVFLDFPEFSGKWLEFLKQVLPQVTRVAVFWDPTNGTHQLNAIKSAAVVLGITLDTIEVRIPADAEAAFSTVNDRGAGALVMLSSACIGGNTKLFADLALARRLPAVTVFTDFARDGGLMAYGPNLLAYYRQQGVMAGKILQGASPAELPVEAPTKFEFVLNLKTAMQLNLTIPPSILLRADEVIE
jgi:putative tryptophan/tyrosine transport system substrate-binding protein